MKRVRGFTLIELLTVLVIVALLLSIVAPRYLQQTDRAKEAVLRENLQSLRISLDKYYADRGHYPVALADLVQQRYLRQLPVDPITEQTESWQLVSVEENGKVGIQDVKSGAPGESLDGTPYSSW